MKKTLVILPQAGKIFEGDSAGGSESSSVDIFQNIENTTFYVLGKSNYQSRFKKINLIFKKSKLEYYLGLPIQIIKHRTICSRALSKATPLYYILSKLFNKKTIYFVANDTDIGLEINHAAKYYSWVPKYTYPFVDILITQTNIQKINLLQKYPKKNIYYLPKAITIWDSIKTTNRDYILWVGRSGKTKGVDILNRLIKDLPKNINLKVVGIAKTEIPTSPNVIYLNRLNSNELPKQYAEAKFLINTSYVEGWPSVFLEALSQKTPVVSYVSNPDRFLEKSGGGICANSDYNLFKNKIIDLYNNPKKSQKLGLNGYNYILKNHNIKNYITSIKKIIEEC